MKRHPIRKILLWLLALVVVAAGLLFAVGYLYYAKILRTLLIETVARESKGLYRAEIGNLTLNVLGGNLTVDRFSLQPDTALYRSRQNADTLSPLLVRVTINRFQVTGFQVMKAIRERKIDIRLIRFTGPAVTVFRMKIPVNAENAVKKERMMSLPLPKGLSAIAVNELLVEGAKLEFVDCTRDSVTRNFFPLCNIVIKEILVDSVHRGTHRLFNAADISIKLGAYGMPLKDGLNKISFGEAGLSTGSGEVYLKEFHLEPLYDKFSYSRKVGYQADRMDVRISRLHLARINLRELLATGRLEAGLLEADSLVLQDYRDNRVPDRRGFRPPMPQESLRKLKTSIRIDTILVKNGLATYQEQVGDEPGTLFFSGIGATFTGLTNDTILLKPGLVSELKASALLMGKGKVDATFRFNLADPRNSFTFSARIGPMALAEINPMLSNLMPAKVVSGQLNRLDVSQVFANDDLAQGKLGFYYQDLSICVVDRKQSWFSKIKTGVVNWAANDLVISNNNPSKSGKMKTGIIHFRRNKQSSIFNFLWKSVLSGLKSTMGFNSKAQKEIIRAEKGKK
ncbi:MAG: DUF748 domain-containing protein [Bacteroidota bacterium]